MVEFGLVVMLFVLLISGIIDFGVLLNARLSLSSMSRVIARAAAANAANTELDALANGQDHIIGVTTDTFSGYCCTFNISGNVTDAGRAIEVIITYYDQASGAVIPAAQRQPGDRVMIQVTGQGMEVLTPFVRPAFGCNGSQRHCFVPLSAQTTMRVERT